MISFLELFSVCTEIVIVKCWREPPLHDSVITVYIQRFLHDPFGMRVSNLGDEELRNDPRNKG